MKRIISFSLFLGIVLIVIVAASQSAKAQNLPAERSRSAIVIAGEGHNIGGHWRHHRRGHWVWVSRTRSIFHRRANHCMVL